MTVFNLVAGLCGIIAFLVLSVQGALLLRTERHVWLVRDPGRSLEMAKRACEARRLTYSELTGTAPGLTVQGMAFKVRSVRAQGERENWL
jgi:cation transport regulator ChaC